MDTKKNKYDYILINVAKAILSAYDAIDEAVARVGAAPQKSERQNAPTRTSNDIPVCSVHGKAMRPSKYKEGQYYCGAKLDDGTYCREKG